MRTHSHRTTPSLSNTHTNADKYVHRTCNRNDSVISNIVVLLLFLWSGHNKPKRKINAKKQKLTYVRYVMIALVKRVGPSKSMSKWHNEWIFNAGKKNAASQTLHTHTHTSTWMHPILWWKILYTQKLLTWFSWYQNIAGGSGPKRIVQVRFIVLPLSTYKSGPPNMMAAGSVVFEFWLLKTKYPEHPVQPQVNNKQWK